MGREPSRQRPLLAVAWMLAASTLFSLMFLAAKHAMRTLPWHEVAAGRAAFGAITIWLLARVRRVSLSVHDQRVQWARTGAGILAMACGFFALSRISIGDAVTIGNLSPLFVAIVAHRFLGEKAGRALVAAIVLGLVGVALLAGAQLHSQRALLGVAAGVAGALCSCAAMIFLRRLGPRESAEGVSLHFAAWSAVVFLTLGLGRQIAPTPRALLSLVGAGVFGGVAQVAMTRAYGYDQAARVGAIGYSGVVISQVFGAILLAEIPTSRQLLGALLVISAGVAVAVGRRPDVDLGRDTG